MALKQVLANAFDSAAKFTDKNTPAILTGLALAGVVTTVVLTVHATKEATLDILEDDELPVDEDGNIPKKEIVKKVWKRYVPVVGGIVLTGVCIVGAQHINHRRQVALAAAYELADTALKTYKQEVIEQIGKNKEKKIQASVDDKVVKRDPPKEEFVANLHDNDVVFRDSMTGQYFVSNIDKVKAAAHKANSDMHNDRVYLNDFLYDCGANFSDMGNDYYMDYFETGEIYVEDLITYSEQEIHGHTFVVGTLHYDCKNRYV